MNSEMITGDWYPLSEKRKLILDPQTPASAAPADPGDVGQQQQRTGDPQYTNPTRVCAPTLSDTTDKPPRSRNTSSTIS